LPWWVSQKINELKLQQERVTLRTREKFLGVKKFWNRLHKLFLKVFANEFTVSLQARFINKNTGIIGDKLQRSPEVYSKILS